MMNGTHLDDSNAGSDEYQVIQELTANKPKELNQSAISKYINEIFSWVGFNDLMETNRNEINQNFVRYIWTLFDLPCENNIY